MGITKPLFSLAHSLTRIMCRTHRNKIKKFLLRLLLIPCERERKKEKRQPQPLSSVCKAFFLSFILTTIMTKQKKKFFPLKRKKLHNIWSVRCSFIFSIIQQKRFNSATPDVPEGKFFLVRESTQSKYVCHPHP